MAQPGKFASACVHILVAACLSTSCVVHVANRPGRAEDDQIPRAVAAEPSAEQQRAHATVHPEPRPQAPETCRRCVWIPGSQHFDGARYVWVPGHFEELSPPYAVTSAPLKESGE